MPTRNYQSIGEVLVTVKTEFPDITISKIRFLGRGAVGGLRRVTASSTGTWTA
jgi:hypothetical protein